MKYIIKLQKRYLEEFQGCEVGADDDGMHGPSPYTTVANIGGHRSTPAAFGLYTIQSPCFFTINGKKNRPQELNPKPIKTMNTQTQLTEEQRKTLLERVAKTQDGGLSHWPTETGQAKKRSKLSMWDEDHLSKFLAHQIEQADDPWDVHNACKYAISELERAAFAAGKYGDELEAGE